jgi:hypothetical protein
MANTIKVEKKLCQFNPGLEMMYVKRCVKNHQIIYLKVETNKSATDMGGSTIYNERGDAICESSAFGRDRDRCNEYLFRCNTEEEKKICSSGGW